MSITQKEITLWIERYAEAVRAHVDELNKMDAAIGDGDYGASILRGVNAATALIPSLEGLSIGGTLKKIGMKMMSTMGGTSGPLTGTLYVKMGSAAGDKLAITLAEFAAAFKAGVEGVMALGKAEVGDKTMIDSLYPAAEALVAAGAQQVSFKDGSAKATQAAKRGYETTADLVARKGRSSYVGERGRGAIDPGAYSAYLLMKAFEEVVGQEADLKSHSPFSNSHL
ncbi:MAG: dihydroxyacetone kinase subunit DhaL [Chloroflexota bacterium]